MAAHCCKCARPVIFQLLILTDSKLESDSVLLVGCRIGRHRPCDCATSFFNHTLSRTLVTPSARPLSPAPPDLVGGVAGAVQMWVALLCTGLSFIGNTWGQSNHSDDIWDMMDTHFGMLEMCTGLGGLFMHCVSWKDVFQVRDFPPHPGPSVLAHGVAGWGC
jgi:hypothetical protein